MAGKLQRWFNENIWEGDKRNYPDGLTTINGTLLQSIFGGEGFTDEKVTIRQSLRIAGVNICIGVRGYTMASMPCNVYKSEGQNTTLLRDHYAYNILCHEPNSYMSAANFWITIMLHMDAWGNGYARIKRDSRQNPVELHIMAPWDTEIVYNDGDIFYQHKGESYPNRDVLHYRMSSFDGVRGLSPILENQDTMGMAMKLKRYSSLLMGAQPPGVLSYEGNLTPTQMAENKKSWKEGNKGDVKVLSGRWKYDPIMTPADETQYNFTKEGNEREIYGIWHVPPTFAMNFKAATYTNAEQSDLTYAKHTVTPICTVIEKENNMKLFFEREKATTYTKFNMNGLLRGDIASRTAFYQAMVNIGGFSRNEIRDLEDRNPYEGGEVPLVQGAMIPGDKEGIDSLRKKMEKDVIPSAPLTKNGHLNGHAHAN